MTGAKVNGRIVPFTQILQNGDIVEVITSNASKGPSRDWLGIVKSSEARNKIRQWFKKERREENIEQGKAMFESELRRALISIQDVTSDELLPRILKRLAYPTLDDLYAAIGYGGASAQKAVNKIKDEVRTVEKSRKKDEAEIPAAAPKSQQKNRKPVSGVVVEGIDNCLVKFSRCCTPVPGDEIAGFITRGFGVSVHRKDCNNYIKSIANPEEKQRWIGVEWANSEHETFSTTLHVTSRERSGLVMDIATVLNSANVKMSSLSARDEGNGISTAVLSLNVKNSAELRLVMTKLSSISGVTEVTRNDR